MLYFVTNGTILVNITKISTIFLLILCVTKFSYTAEGKSNISVANKASTQAKAKSEALQHLPGVIAERGFKNVLFGWTDIPCTIIQMTNETKNPLWGLTAGTLKGAGKAFPRTISGVVDVATFPLADYNKSLVNPDELNTQIK